MAEPQLRAQLQQLQDTDAGAMTQSARIAEHLVEGGLLTPWQSNQLLQGRFRGFCLGNYRLLDQIGVGGMSTVFLGEHMKMEREVAIKVLPKNKVQNPAYLDRFLVEARAAAALSHPNIVRAYDFDRDGDTHFLVMERLHGTTLHATVRAHHPLPLAEIIDYMQQAAEGLAYAHRQGMVHRDIKPANLMITEEKQLKILDMGLAHWPQPAAGTKTEPNAVVGTADFLAPEQAVDSRRVDLKADIYSLGCTLYFSLGGQAPFPGGSIQQKIARHQSEPPVPITSLRPDCPPPLARLCAAMMAKDPTQRTESMGTVAEQLGRIELIGLPPSADTQAKAPPIQLASPSRRRRRRSRSRSLPWWFWLILVALLGACGVLWQQLRVEGILP